MAEPIENQVIRSYASDPVPGTGEFQIDMKNQQLNDALASGTIDGILLKSGYSAVYDYHVLVKKDIAGLISASNIEEEINAVTTFDFGTYNAARELFVKSNGDPTTKSIPNIAQIRRRGEIAVDNFDGSLYLLGNQATEVVKVNAGTINGFKVEKDVLIDEYIDTAGVKALINSAFEYDDLTNSLTIAVVV